MKKILVLLVVIIFISSSCTSIKDDSSGTIQSNATNAPAFLQEIGKTYDMLKEEHPAAVIQHYDIPDASAECLSEPESKYSYCFFGTQSVVFEDYAGKVGNQVKCAGFYTTSGVLFHKTEDNMPTADFFSAIGVSAYEYDTDVSPAQGWFSFKYKDMDVWLDTTSDSISADGEFKPVTNIKSHYPVVIINSSIEEQNQILINNAQK